MCLLGVVLLCQPIKSPLQFPFFPLLFPSDNFTTEVNITTNHWISGGENKIIIFTEMHEMMLSETSGVMAPGWQRRNYWDTRETGVPFTRKHPHWDNARVTATDNAAWTKLRSPLSEPPQVPEQTDPSTQWRVEVRGHDDPCLFWLTPRNVSNCRARSVWTVIKVRFSSARTRNSSLRRAISMVTVSSSTSSAINSFLRERNDTCWSSCYGDYYKLGNVYYNVCFCSFPSKSWNDHLKLLRSCVQEDIMFSGFACNTQIQGNVWSPDQSIYK